MVLGFVGLVWGCVCLVSGVWVLANSFGVGGFVVWFGWQICGCSDCGCGVAVCIGLMF